MALKYILLGKKDVILQEYIEIMMCNTFIQA